MPPFRGLVAFPITPADPAGRVDAPGVEALCDRLAAAGVDSVGLLGSTGSYAYLSRTERRRAVEAAKGAIGRRAGLIVGVGALATHEAVALARDAEAAGADGLLLAPVSYTPLLDAEVAAHVVAVAGATTLPLCLYNNPSTTHFSMADDLVEALAAVPGVVAVKHPAPPAGEAASRIAALRARMPGDFAIGFSADWLASAALLAGADAWYSVVAGLLPGPALALHRAACAGDAVATRRIEAAFQPLWALFREHGSLRVVHAAANLLGLTDRQPPRPILPLGPSVVEQVARALADLPA